MASETQGAGISQLRDLAGRRGASVIARNTVKSTPDTPADGYAAGLGDLARTGRVQADAG